MTQLHLLTLGIGLACAFAFLLRRFKQPLIVSYLAAGALLSAFHIVRPEQLEFLKFLPEIGLAFLLFLVGMELDLAEFKGLGRNIVLATLLQTAVSTLLLAALTAQFGIDFGQALIIGLALAFSSTILVVKLLLENKELQSLHGKLAVGILLLEDLLAIVFLMFLSIPGASDWGLSAGFLIVVKGAILIWMAFFLGRRFLPKVFFLAAENAELMFLTAISWCLIFVSISLIFGFSAGIGAFLAGVSLAQSTFRIQISGRIKPLRDFFIMVFFIDLGAGLSISAVGSYWLLVILLIIYALVVKPIIFYVLLTQRRFGARSAFETSIYLSSISEFSLIVLFLAGKNGLVQSNLTSPLIFATVASFVCSSFLITHNRRIYLYFHKWLKKLEKANTLNLDFVPKDDFVFSHHAVLAGAHTSGGIILKCLQRVFGEQVLVVDFNPDIISALKDKGVSCIYGDVADPDVCEKLNLKEAKLVVSTVRMLSDNLALLDYLEKVQSPAVVIITANDSKEAVTLYERGAHHVSIPVNLEGVTINHLLTTYQHDFKSLARERERKLGELERQSA